MQHIGATLRAEGNANMGQRKDSNSPNAMYIKRMLHASAKCHYYRPAHRLLVSARYDVA